MKIRNLLLLAMILVIPRISLADVTQKHRVIILTDIEADTDDTESMVRLMLYSNQIDIKGIVATTSTHMRTSIHPESIRRIIKGYGKVRSNLLLHEQGFPTEDYLQSIVKSSIPAYGMKAVGKGKDTEGSKWIIKTLEEKDERPLWISAWGGTNTLAQALYTISHTKSKSEAKSLISKLRIYAISDQDDSGIWIRNNYPELFYIVSPGNYRNATWLAINQVVDKGFNNEVISTNWILKNIQQGTGALGRLYQDVMWGMEGDTPSYLSLIPNGLNEPEHPNWGGWGGRYEFYKPEFKADEGAGGVETKPETRAIWTNASDKYSPCVYNPYGRALKMDESKSLNDNRATILRWREDFQNDFAARMQWCVKPYNEANHAPVPGIVGDCDRTVKGGEWLTLDASPSYDPDDDHLSYLWISYPEAGTYKESIIKDAQVCYRVNMQLPKVKKPETAHIILKVTDHGTPSISRYKRVILTIVP